MSRPDPEAGSDSAALPLPPAAMRFMGESDERFLATGDESVAELREVVGLGDGERLLDVGCGYGRLAHALLRDGGFAGTYLGLDILPGPIAWCEEELAPRSGGRFSFRRIDVANERYRPEGGTPPERAELGVEPGSFDVAALISVFTHLDPPAVERYLHEIAAALTPGGRAFISAFLLNRSWRELEEAGRSPIPLPHRLTSFCRYQDPDDPLYAIGYKPAWLVARAEEAGLELAGRPRLGTWCGRPDGAGHLDVLALRRPAG
jgi:SAM-dependent methyltransferase